MTDFRYWQNQMPEGTALCMLCFESFPLEDMYVDAGGQMWDSCKACEKAEASRD